MPVCAIQPRTHFTADDDARIRAAWPDITELARQMGRLRRSLSARGRKLGLPRQVHHRRFSEVEIQMIIDRYPAEGPTPLARELGRSLGVLVALAQRLGVPMYTRWKSEEDARFVELKKQGKSHREIGALMNRSETACAKRAKELGLSVCHYDPVRVRQRYLNSHAPGHMGPGSRWARKRSALGEHGWMPDLNPKEIAILESLRTRGPQERKVLALSIGEPANRDRKKFLRTHGGISSMARIMARGLVARMRLTESKGNGKRGGYRVIYIYTLTETALKAWGSFTSVRAYNAELANRRPGDAKRIKHITNRESRKEIAL